MSSTTRRVAAVAIASMLALTSFAAEAATKSKSAQHASDRAEARALQNSRAYGYVDGGPVAGSNMYGGSGGLARDNTAGWGNIGIQ